jgi:hypothetical protein
MTQPYIVKAYNYAVTKDGASTAPTLAKLYDHFQNTSTLWEIDTGSSTTDPSKAFTIRPKTGLQYQINFRRYDSVSNRVNVTIDPDASITDAEATVGDSESALPSTASAKAFNNTLAFSWSTNSLVGEGLWLIELDNALFIMNKLENTRSVYGCHIGRILTPPNENDPLKGMEGFGILGNQLGWSRVGVATNDRQIMRTGLGPGLRLLKVSNSEGSKTVNIYLGARGSFETSGDPKVLDVADRKQLETIYVKVEGSSGRYIGVLKYIHPWPYEMVSGHIFVDTNSNQRFIYNNPSTSTSYSFQGLLIPWEDGVSQI